MPRPEPFPEPEPEWWDSPAGACWVLLVLAALTAVCVAELANRPTWYEVMALGGSLVAVTLSAANLRDVVRRRRRRERSDIVSLTHDWPRPLR